METISEVSASIAELFTNRPVTPGAYASLAGFMGGELKTMQPSANALADLLPVLDDCIDLTSGQKALLRWHIESIVSGVNEAANLYRTCTELHDSYHAQ